MEIQFRAVPDLGAAIAKADRVARLSLVVVLVVVAIGAAAMRRPQLADCAFATDRPGPLHLEDRAARERLADELARIDVVASNFRERIRSDPPQSPAAHALRSHETRPDRAFRYCQIVLREQLAKDHALSDADLPPPAESERAEE